MGANDAANLLIAHDIGIVKDEVLHHTAGGNHAEKPLALVFVGGAALVDADAAHGVPVAVKGALERMAPAADGGEVAGEACGFVPGVGAAVAVGDVGAELEVFAAEIVSACVSIIATPRFLGEPVELRGVDDHVWIGRGAAAGPGDFYGGAADGLVDGGGGGE